jgi:hypothetical protein
MPGVEEPPDSGAFEPPLRRALVRTWTWLRGPPGAASYRWFRFWFLRGLGLVYLAAFCAALFQNEALIGEHGLLPAWTFLDAVLERQDGDRTAAFLQLPTVFWIDASDAALTAVAGVGVALSLLLLLGLNHPLQLLVLWAAYLSIDHVGQRWYMFGWESQLLETGLLAVFLLPWNGVRALPRPPPPDVVVGLARWLTFRIMIGAGLIKLRGDPCWRDLSCLDYHFETQPNPHPLSWWIHQLPDWMLAGGVLYNHLAELVVPLFVFGPRRLRHLAGVVLLVFQVGLILSGNLSFLNWLTLLPCLACFDDAFLGRLVPQRLRARLERGPRARRPGPVQGWSAAAFALLVAWLSVPVVQNLAGSRQAMNRSYDRLHVVNTYGAFGGVGEHRFELVIEGTLDTDSERARWREYEFRCKPGRVDRRPCWITPYHLRLDWLIWFAALEAAEGRGLQREDWLLHLLHKLLIADPAVLALFADDPFAGTPPRFVRVSMWRYSFTRIGEADGAWWKRERLGTFVRPVSLDDEAFTGYLRWRGWIDAE